MAEKLLEVKNLRTEFKRDKTWVTAVNNVSFSIQPGEILGLVGESGCGKSVTSLSIMKLLARNSKISNGEILLNGKDLLKEDKKGMRKIRGREVAMIFQEPMTSLNPVYTIGNQIVEVILLHTKKTKQEAWARARELLELVGINEPEKRLKQYPHELSGGMRQRVMIAMALAGNPKLIIADEPTTALDVTIQAQILELLKDLQRNQGCSIMLITHDLGVIAEMADEVVVMYAGKVIERGTASEIFHNPLHPYTIGLQKSKPLITSDSNEPLYSIPGQVPNPINLPNTCYFKNRCSKCTAKCNGEYPHEIKYNDEHYVSCYLYEERNDD